MTGQGFKTKRRIDYIVRRELGFQGQRPRARMYLEHSNFSGKMDVFYTGSAFGPKEWEGPTLPVGRGKFAIDTDVSEERDKRLTFSRP
ncbi:hypothetical protein M404DRAFT_996967 [Pisolithus tinctorius Marx 270]|uniref:Uncharacterized protein n=1 Tax=Pisolithus tinctorius Marx 270 TaxID=870435 RepID=A0A0C3KGK3_PISTI|nr:hypothetical protein M404DRAFT_996967 [Pisolithus tinctorius Marx 270]